MTIEEPATTVGGRRAAVVFGVLFLAMSAAAFVWGGIVTTGVRERAVITDRHIRAAGWRMLCAAAATGEWPKDLSATATVACDQIAGGAGGWPTTSAQACPGGVEPWAAASGVVISHDPKGVGAPRISAGGRPTGIGTLETVNGWLQAFQEAHFAGKHAPTAP